MSKLTSITKTFPREQSYPLKSTRLLISQVSCWTLACLQQVVMEVLERLVKNLYAPVTKHAAMMRARTSKRVAVIVSQKSQYKNKRKKNNKLRIDCSVSSHLTFSEKDMQHKNCGPVNHNWFYCSIFYSLPEAKGCYAVMHMCGSLYVCLYVTLFVHSIF